MTTDVTVSRNATDLGNAERLAARYGSDLRFVPRMGKWLVWDGARWAGDETGRVHQYAKETVRAIYDEAAELPDRDERKAMIQHALKSEHDARLRAMISRVQYEPGIAARTAELDANPWRLAVANGTVDLRRGALDAHRREDLITKLVPIEFDPSATCARWDSFLSQIMGGDPDLVAFLQRAVGYSLTGDTGEQCLFFLHGSGANGKSTFLDLLRTLLGDYAVQADFATFLETTQQKGGPRNDIAGLAGARLVTSSEVGEGRRLAESVVKTLTGGDVVSARFLYHEQFEFRPQFKLWLAANHKPVIRGTDYAMWRRVKLVPFKVEIPEADRDQQLAVQLRRELPGILRWAVEGCQAWLEFGLQVPAIVQEATAGYREESDVLGAFLSDMCVLSDSPYHMVRASVLYDAYRRWAEAGGEFVMSQTAFGRRLQDRGIGSIKSGTGSGRLKYRTGIRLNEAELSANGGGGDGPGQYGGRFRNSSPIYPSSSLSEKRDKPSHSVPDTERNLELGWDQ